jgi:hypothetical protein
MTKQIPDTVVYKGQEFILAGLKGTRLFFPIDFGITGDMMGIATACYRRYFCHYVCTQQELFLVRLNLIQGEVTDLPLITGIAPRSDRIGLFQIYEDLRIPCHFSGGLILVRDPIDDSGISRVPLNMRW